MPSSPMQQYPARTMSSVDRPLFVGLHPPDVLQPVASSSPLQPPSSDLRDWMCTPESIPSVSCAASVDQDTLLRSPPASPSTSPRLISVRTTPVKSTPACMQHSHTVVHATSIASSSAPPPLVIQESSPPRYSIHTLPPPTTPIEVNLNTNAACKHDVFTRLAVVMPTGSIMVFLLLANITTGAGQVRQGDVGATVVFVILAACTCLLLSLSDELCEQSDTRVIFRLPGGCIALHPPLYPRLRRDPRCAATASDYLHAAVSTAIFLSVVLLSPPVTLCLFPGTEPGTSRVGGIWSMFVPLIVTLLGGTLIALLDTPLRAPLGFGSCTARHGVVEEGGGGVEEGGEVVQQQASASVQTDMAPHNVDTTQWTTNQVFHTAQNHVHNNATPDNVPASVPPTSAQLIGQQSKHSSEETSPRGSMLIMPIQVELPPSQGAPPSPAPPSQPNHTSAASFHTNTWSRRASMRVTEPLVITVQPGSIGQRRSFSLPPNLNMRT